jgi:hypothetical protein
MCGSGKLLYSIKGILWNVEYTDEFGVWWHGLNEDQQEDFAAIVQLLMEHGPQLPFPYSSGVEGSKHAHRRELRVQSGGKPLRGFYAFDPRRTASCLLAGTKPETIVFTKR